MDYLSVRQFGLTNVYLNYKRHIVPLLVQNLLKITIPDKPKSRLQKYRLTEKGRAALADMDEKT